MLLTCTFSPSLLQFALCKIFLKRFEFYEQKCFLKMVLNQLLSKAHKKQELGQTGNHFERENVWLTFC